MKSHICVYSDLSEQSCQIFESLKKSGIDLGVINITNKASLRQILSLKIISCVPTILQIDTRNDMLNLYHGVSQCLCYMKDSLGIGLSAEITGGNNQSNKDDFSTQLNQGHIGFKSSNLDTNIYSKEVRGNILPDNLISENEKPKSQKKISIMEQAKQMSTDRENEMKIIGPAPIGMM